MEEGGVVGYVTVCKELPFRFVSVSLHPGCSMGLRDSFCLTGSYIE